MEDTSYRLTMILIALGFVGGLVVCFVWFYVSRFLRSTNSLGLWKDRDENAPDPPISASGAKRVAHQGLVIDYCVVERGVEIICHKKGFKNHRVLGFRHDHSMPLTDYTADGTPILDTPLGVYHTIDYPGVGGRTYYYRFFLEVYQYKLIEVLKFALVGGPRPPWCSSIKFDAYVPSGEELLAKQVQKERGFADEIVDRRKKLYEEMLVFVETRRALAETEQTLISGINGDQMLSEQQKKELIEDLKEKVSFRQRNLPR